ncbi:MAG: hypothetical protein IJ482_00435, partial [Alphaproteobacteria bacterium]|nr:hypothetical protein [Alphaproteobacteria bacterium]
ELADNEEIADMREELTDRFGPLPEEVNNLLATVEIKLLCKDANIDKVDAGAKGILISLRNNVFAKPDKLIEFVASQFGAVKIRPDQKLFIEKDLSSYKTRVETIRKYVAKIQSLLQ